MTSEEDEALILEKEGRLCVRYYQRHDGTILMKDCVIGVKRKRKRRIIVAGAAAMLAGGVAYAIAMQREQREERIMGSIGAAPTDMTSIQGGIQPLPEPPEVDPHEAPHAQAKADEVEIRLGEWK